MQTPANRKEEIRPEVHILVEQMLGRPSRKYTYIKGPALPSENFRVKRNRQAEAAD